MLDSQEVDEQGRIMQTKTQRLILRGQHENSAAQYQTLSLRLHNPPLFIDFLRIKHAAPASSARQSSRGAFCFSTRRTSSITMLSSTALTMSYTVSRATATAVSASIS